MSIHDVEKIFSTSYASNQVAVAPLYTTIKKLDEIIITILNNYKNILKSVEDINNIKC